jgi:hypothetical protein
VIQFLVGIIVGAAIVGLIVILLGPSRQVRAEHPLPPDVEAKLLLGEDPDQPTIPPTRRPDQPRQYTPNELAALQRLSQQPKRKNR